MEKVSYSVNGEAVEQVAQRCFGSRVPRDFQGQAGSGPQLTDLAVDVPVHCRGVGLDGLQRSLPALRILFYDSVSNDRQS